MSARFDRGERIAASIWDRRWLLILLCAAITLLAASQATRIGVDNSLRIWFAENDPQLVAYRQFQQSFGNDEVVVIAFREPGGIATPAGIELLRRAEQVVADVPGVDGTLSLARLLDALEPLPASRMIRDEAIRNLKDDARFHDRLVSRDGTTAALIVRMATGDETDSHRDRTLTHIDAALDTLQQPAHKAGIGVVYAALNRLSVNDALVLFCGAFILMFVLLWIIYGRLAPALVTMGIAAVAMTWTIGLYGAAGRSLNMITAVMPTVILVVGVAEVVHVLLHAADIGDDMSRREKVCATIGFMMRPCLVNIVTSAIGFATLAASPLPAVRDLGVFTAAGLMGCLALTVVGCTFALAWPVCEPKPGRLNVLASVAERLCRVGMRHPIPTLSMSGAVAVAGIAASAMLTVDTFTLHHIAAEHPVRRDSEFIEMHLGPYVPMNFVVQSPGNDVTAELLGAIEAWQRSGERLPSVGWSRSLADMLPRSDDRISVQELLDKYRAEPMARLDPLLDEDGTLRVTFSVRMQSANDVARTMRLIEDEAQLPPGTMVTPAGYLPMYVRMIEHIVGSQIASFSFAFVAVFAVILLALRSARLTALALPSNLLPLLLVLAVMGISGIWLDAATVTIASVVLGLVVDDTVHFLYRLRKAITHHSDRDAALIETARTAGRAILTTSVVMTAGFSVFTFAEIKSVTYFGLLIALAMSAGVLTDLLVVPALFACRRVDRSTAPGSAGEIAYAQCWEDADVLLEALDARPGAVYLSIASAGDNTLALLSRSPQRVIAIDSNPTQIACIELRASAYRILSHDELLELIGSVASTRRAELYRRCRGNLSAASRNFWDSRPAAIAAGIGSAGRFERYLSIFRERVLPLVHPPAVVDKLLRGGSNSQRSRFYSQVWDTWRWRAMYRLFFSRAVMSRLGRDPSCFRYVDGKVSERLLARTHHGLTAIDPARNPYLQWICSGSHLTALPYALRPENFEAIRANLDRIEWQCCSLNQYLENAAPGTVDGFNLSDVFEYMSPHQYCSTLEKLARVGKPGARIVYWNMLADRHRPEHLATTLRPLNHEAHRLHQRDKAFFYSTLVIEQIA